MCGRVCSSGYYPYYGSLEGVNGSYGCISGDTDYLIKCCKNDIESFKTHIDEIKNILNLN